MKGNIVKTYNGGETVYLNTYVCDNCNQNIEAGSPLFSATETIHYCIDCSFMNNLIKSDEYVSLCGLSDKMFKAGLNESGEIIIWPIGQQAPFIRRISDKRNTPEYATWRKAVLERDNYKCTQCGTSEGTLIAHHIKSFNQFVKLRTDINNGITLCDHCHRKEHKKIRGMANG